MKRLGPAATLALLTACAAPPPEPEPTRAPIARPVRAPVTAPVVQSSASEALERYYARVQNALRAQGLLRTDRGGQDTPFSARDLVENFERIALYEEYATEDGRIVARQTESRLHKWTDPIRVQLEFGASVDDRQRNRDRAAVGGYTARLARVSGHSIGTVEDDGNFHVFIVGEDDRVALGPRLRQLIPNLSEAAIATVTGLPRTNYCVAFALDPYDTGVYRTAVAIIRAEHPELLRLSCIHEEVAQGLGLSNDSPMARPSIFNDDEEFALLTTHDEMLLRMLYDPRMEPGMTAAEALPIAREIANELMPGT